MPDRNNIMRTDKIIKLKAIIDFVNFTAAMYKNLIYLVFTTTMLLSLPGFAQKKTKVKLIRSDQLIMDDNFNANIQRLIGNVVMLHDSTLLLRQRMAEPQGEQLQGIQQRAYQCERYARYLLRLPQLRWLHPNSRPLGQC